MSQLIVLHRYDRSTANPSRPIFINPDLIATVELVDFVDHYTRIELASGNVVKVTEEPDRVLDDIRVSGRVDSNDPRRPGLGWAS